MRLHVASSWGDGSEDSSGREGVGYSVSSDSYCSIHSFEKPNNECHSTSTLHLQHSFTEIKAGFTFYFWGWAKTGNLRNKFFELLEKKTQYFWNMYRFRKGDKYTEEVKKQSKVSTEIWSKIFYKSGKGKICFSFCNIDIIVSVIYTLKNL